ncbi:hypothetical protein DENSPDRAFT_831583 [Dentipellis sp. KUC8613]|nr:hypothetical protein DENSPDRAFT_831583 [Dentipellis sp. KUC8613]
MSTALQAASDPIGPQRWPHHAYPMLPLAATATPYAQHSFRLPSQVPGPSVPSPHATHTYNPEYSQYSIALPQVPPVPSPPSMQSTGSIAGHMREEGTLVVRSVPFGASSSVGATRGATGHGLGKRTRDHMDTQVQESAPTAEEQFGRYAHIQKFPCCGEATQNTSLYMHYTSRKHLKNLPKDHQKFVKAMFWICCPRAGCKHETNRSDDMLRHIGIDSNGVVQSPPVNQATGQVRAVSKERQECQLAWTLRSEVERNNLLAEWERKASKATARATAEAAIAEAAKATARATYEAATAEASDAGVSSSSSSSSSSLSPVGQSDPGTPSSGSGSSVSASATATTSPTTVSGETASDCDVSSSEPIEQAPRPLAAASVPSCGSSPIPPQATLVSQSPLPNIPKNKQAESGEEEEDMSFYRIGNREEDIARNFSTLCGEYGYEP